MLCRRLTSTLPCARSLMKSRSFASSNLSLDPYKSLSNFVARQNPFYATIFNSLIEPFQRRDFHVTNSLHAKEGMHGTTVLCVRKKGEVALMADGQVTQGNAIVKANAKKLRQVGDKTVAGFAGSTADAITLFERLEQKLEAHPGQLMRACVELAKDWRTDKYLRKLDAVLIVADAKISLLLSGNGDVLEPSGGVLGIGSGGEYAVAAATALMDVEELSAEQVAEKAMKIASDICIYTNSNFTRLKIGTQGTVQLPQ